MNARGNRFICRHCHRAFVPDYRNRHHQQYCPSPVCRTASKRASQRRWCLKPENRAHFCGSEAVERVQEWRRKHPGYWRGQVRRRVGTLQEVCSAQAAVTEPPPGRNPPGDFSGTLQDLCRCQTPLLIGLLAQLNPSPLQDDMARYAWRVVNTGQSILDQLSSKQSEKTTAYDTEPHSQQLVFSILRRGTGRESGGHCDQRGAWLQ